MQNHCKRTELEREGWVGGKDKLLLSTSSNSFNWFVGENVVGLGGLEGALPTPSSSKNGLFNDKWNWNLPGILQLGILFCQEGGEHFP